MEAQEVNKTNKTIQAMYIGLSVVWVPTREKLGAGPSEAVYTTEVSEQYERKDGV